MKDLEDLSRLSSRGDLQRAPGGIFLLEGWAPLPGGTPGNKLRVGLLRAAS